MSKKHPIRIPEYTELMEKLGTSLEIPAGSLPGGVHIELENNTRALIEGCAGVMEYGDSSVKLNLGRMMLRISGSALTITSMQNGQAEVSGQIAQLEFLN